MNRILFRLIALILLVTTVQFSFAQVCSQPGMTPATAIPVCGTQVFTQNIVVSCTAQDLAPNSGCPATPITTDNSFWYKFTCFTSGTLGFSITPQGGSTDFDWALLDVTGRPISDIYTDVSLQVRLNLSGDFGATGCRAAGNGTISCAGSTPLFNTMPNIIAGHDYLLQIANWSNNNTGYTLQFGGGDAVITDPSPAAVIGSATVSCTNQNEISVTLSKDIKCSSLTASGSEFIVNPGGFVPVSATSTCQSGTFGTRILTLQFASALPFGNYTLEVQNGTDGNTLLDACNNPTPVGTSLAVVVPARPIASFTDQGPYCIGQNITFTDASLPVAGTLTNWNWDLGDGTIINNSSGAPFTHTYTAGGTYTVILVVSNNNCSSPAFSRQVTITPQPVPGFTHLPACLPNGLVSFTNTSTITAGALSYVWDFGDPASGSANSSTIANPSHFYNNPGPFSVKLTATSTAGCIANLTLPVNDVYAQAKGDFNVSPEYCLNAQTAFISTSNPLTGNTITDWFWDFGNGQTSLLQNPLYVYPAAGTYTVKHWIRTDKNCNSDTMTKTVVINPLPTANFTSSNPLCETKTVTFTDGSAANAGTLTGWAWAFGDGSTAAIQNPVHTYTTAGTYNVTLQVTSSKGCVSSVLNRSITVQPQPIPGFIIPEVCLTDSYAQFTDTSKIASGSITSWSWNFGDPASGANNTATGPNPQHKFNTIGIYNVALTVTSNSGCVSTLQQPITINGDIPVANFNALNPATFCANDSITIQDASTVNFGSITKVEIHWDNTGTPAVFERDDTPTPGKTYKHKYPNFQSPLTRTFSIRYRAFSGGVCVNDRIKTVVVNAAPLTVFGAVPNLCLDAVPYQVTQAREAGGVPGSGIFSGPGITAGGLFTPSAVGPGTYRILYTYAATAGGCTDTISNTITVLEPGIAAFSPVLPYCEKNALTFADNSTVPAASGSITARTWNFGDGTPLVVRNNDQPFTHTYAAAGQYTVTLSVTTSNGCVSAVSSKLVDVKPLPVPSFTFPASVCIPNAYVQFTNTSSIADGTENSFTFVWDFDDPGSGASNNATSRNPVHFYSSTGPFNVNLQVTSGAGCVQTVSIPVAIVHPQPKADFSLSRPGVCVGDAITLTDLSDAKDGTTTQWNWNLGNGQTRSTPTVTFTYPADNTYNISLYIVNSLGCNSDTITKPFTVHPYPVVSAGPDKLVLEGDPAILQPVVSGNDLQYLWTPNQYFISSNTVAAPAVRGVQDITYTLTVTARGGCSTSDDVFVKVLRQPEIPNTFTPNNDGINDYWAIKYLEDYPDNKVQVFTRTGQLVFERRRYNQPWNGTFNGKPLPVDTYYYIIEPGNSRKPITGFVTLVK